MNIKHTHIHTHTHTHTHTQVYRVYLKCFNKFQEQVPHNGSGKKIHINIYIHRHLVFQVQPKSVLTSFLHLSVGASKNPSLSSSNWKWRDTSPPHFYFWYLSNHSQLPQNLSKGATFYYQMCPFVSWLRQRTFWAFVDLVNSKNLTTVRLVPCISNVLCQL